MAFNSCVHGRRDNIANMKITMSLKATDLTRLSSSGQRIMDDIQSGHTGETATAMAICPAQWV
jgi:hypothetical protein